MRSPGMYKICMYKCHTIFVITAIAALLIGIEQVIGCSAL